MQIDEGFFHSFSRGDAVAGIGVLAGVFFVMIAVTVAISVVFYVLQAVALSTMAKRRGVSRPWLAWIPVGNSWLIGALADHYSLVTGRKPTKYRYILLWGTLGVFFFSVLISGFALATGLGAILSLAKHGTQSEIYAFLSGYIGIFALTMLLSLASIAISVFTYIAVYKIFQSCQPSNAVLFILLSIFISGALPVLLFVARNKDEGMTPIAPYAGGQRPVS